MLRLTLRLLRAVLPCQGLFCISGISALLWAEGNSSSLTDCASVFGLTWVCLLPLHPSSSAHSVTHSSREGSRAEPHLLTSKLAVVHWLLLPLIPLLVLLISQPSLWQSEYHQSPLTVLSCSVPSYHPTCVSGLFLVLLLHWLVWIRSRRLSCCTLISSPACVRASCRWWERTCSSWSAGFSPGRRLHLGTSGAASF